jgi:hypothetical protein
MQLQQMLNGRESAMSVTLVTLNNRAAFDAALCGTAKARGAFA